MKQDEWIELEKTLEKKLDTNRFQHTLGVMYTAAALAMCHGGDLDKARLAGLLHDCAKAMPYEKQKELCAREGVTLSESEKKNHRLLHAKSGMLLAKLDYHVHDHDILTAIRWHTTGKPDMSRLEKIIYIADYIEPNRKLLPNMTVIRKLAFHDLDMCMYRLSGDSMVYLEARDMAVDSLTRETHEYYRNCLTSQEREQADADANDGSWNV